MTRLSHQKLKIPKIILTESEIEKLLQKIKGKRNYSNSLFLIRDYAIIYSLFTTGLRISELLSISKIDFLNHKQPFIVNTKGGFKNTVYFTDRAIDAINHYLKKRGQDNNPFLFISERCLNSKAITTRAIQINFKKYLIQANLPGTNLHSLRHSFANTILENGGAFQALQKLLGHQNASSTQIYNHTKNPSFFKDWKKAHNNL